MASPSNMLHTPSFVLTLYRVPTPSSRSVLYECVIVHRATLVATSCDVVLDTLTDATFRRAARKVAHMLNGHGCGLHTGDDHSVRWPRALSLEATAELLAILSEDDGWWDSDKLTNAQFETITRLTWKRGTPLELSDLTTQPIYAPFDLGPGWIMIEIAGVTYGIDAEGNAHS